MRDWYDDEYRSAERRRYEQIRTEFPHLVTRRFECHQGWYDLLHEFFATVRTTLAAEEHHARFDLYQVKEKLGGLRIHYHLASAAGPAIAAAIFKARLAAEDASFSCCDVCGRPGVLRVANGCYATRCAAHADDGLPCKAERDSDDR
ncbi:hypothetical protein GCM10010837_42890 [Aminobacter niigataensis]